MFSRSKLISAALIMAIAAVAAMACSQPTPAPAIDEARLQSIVESAVAKSAPAPAPQVTAEEISTMVEKSMMGMSESQVSASEIQAMVEKAVESAAMEGASAEEISAMVESAVMAAAEDSITANDVQSAISMAVMEAQEFAVTTEDVQSAVSSAVMEASSDALTAEKVQEIVAMALEDRAMMEEPPRETIIFSDLNWSSAQLQNRIAQYLVEKGYGYPTDVVFGATLPLFNGLRNGDTHVTMEIWLPNQDEAWNAAQAAGEVYPVGLSLGKDWQSAFVIPRYLQEQYPELDSVDDLTDQQFKGPLQDGRDGR